MATDWLLVVHLCYEPSEKPRPGEVFEWLFQYGVHTEESGGNESCSYFAVDSNMDVPESDADTETAVERLRTREGYIDLWVDDVEFTFHNWESEDRIGVPDLPYFTLEFPKGQMRVRDQATRILDFIGEFADETEPIYGFGHEAAGERESHKQDAQRLLNGQLEQLFWVNYLSKRFVDNYDRDRLLRAPAELVEERAHGAVLMVPHVLERTAATTEQVRKFDSVEEHLGL